MSNYSHIFKDNAELNTLPLIEAKMTYQYNHRFATYENATQENINEGNLPQCSSKMLGDPSFRVQPRYWIPIKDIEEKDQADWKHKWFIGFRNVSSGISERTMIASIFPGLGIADTLSIVLSKVENIPLLSCFYSNLNSIIFDFIARQKVGGAHLNNFIVKQFPIIAPDGTPPLISPSSSPASSNSPILPGTSKPSRMTSGAMPTIP